MPLLFALVVASVALWLRTRCRVGPGRKASPASLRYALRCGPVWWPRRWSCARQSGAPEITIMRVPKPLTSEQSRLLEQAETLMRSRIRADGTQLSDPSAAGSMFRYRLANHEREVFSVAFLTTRHRVICVEDLFCGTLDGAEVHSREVAKRALELNAAAIICAHNHPSNNGEPSSADRSCTARLKQALALIDCRLLDHFVVTADGYTSMAERGWV